MNICTLEEWITKDGFTARVVPDDSPPSPREFSNLSTLIQLDSGYFQPDERETDTDLLRAVTKAWEQWHDFDMVARYLRVFHGAVAVEEWTGNGRGEGGRIIGIVTRETMAREFAELGYAWTKDSAQVVVASEIEIYRQWTAGEVYGVVVTAPDGREESLFGIFTENGGTDVPYLRQVAEDLSAEINEQAPHVTTERLHTAARAVLDYMWSDELEDYENADNEEREMHIFRHLQTLRDYLEAVGNK